MKDFLTSCVRSIRIEGTVVARDKMLVHGTRVLGALPGVGVVVRRPWGWDAWSGVDESGVVKEHGPDDPDDYPNGMTIGSGR
jgi:hypothetical protein